MNDNQDCPHFVNGFKDMNKANSNDLTNDYGALMFYLRVILEKNGLRFRKLGEVDFKTLIISRYVSNLETKLQAQLRRIEKKTTDNEMYLVKVSYNVINNNQHEILIDAYDPTESHIYKLTLKQTPINIGKYFFPYENAYVNRSSDKLLEFVIDDLCERLEFKQYEDSGNTALVLKESKRFVDDLQKAFDDYSKGFDFFVNVNQSSLRFSREVDDDGSRALKHKVLESLRTDVLLTTRLINMNSRVDVVFESTGSKKSEY